MKTFIWISGENDVTTLFVWFHFSKILGDQFQDLHRLFLTHRAELILGKEREIKEDVDLQGITWRHACAYMSQVSCVWIISGNFLKLKGDWRRLSLDVNPLRICELTSSHVCFRRAKQYWQCLGEGEGDLAVKVRGVGWDQQKFWSGFEWHWCGKNHWPIVWRKEGGNK